MGLTAELCIFVVRHRSAGMRSTAALRLLTTSTGTRPKPAIRVGPKQLFFISHTRPLPVTHDGQFFVRSLVQRYDVRAEIERPPSGSRYEVIELPDHGKVVFGVISFTSAPGAFVVR